MREKINSRKGFTLAELLVVVAIIAILIAITIPTFKAAQEKSAEAVDLSAIRAAYAELKIKELLNEGSYSIDITMEQTESGWQTETADATLTKLFGADNVSGDVADEEGSKNAKVHWSSGGKLITLTFS